MSGEKNSINDRMNAIQTALDDFEKSCGLPILKNPVQESELEEYFSMNKNVIEKMSAQNCAAVAYRLTQYSLYLQRLVNKEQSRLTWAETVLTELVAPQMNNYDKWTKAEQKIALIAREDTSVANLNKIISYAQQRIDRLTYLSNTIKALSDVMIANQRVKYNEYK